MRIVFIFNEYPLHNHIVERCIEARPSDEFSLVKVPLVLKGKSRADTAQRILPKLPKRFIAGKFVEFVSLLLLTSAPKVMRSGAVFRRLRTIASRHHIPFFQCENVMAPETLEFIRSRNPDLIISLFHQIVKEPLISMPRLGFVNLHPGLIPEFRGIQPYFWQLAERHGSSGATMHFIEDEGIDTGRIIGQVSYRTIPGMSVQLNYFLTAQSIAKTLPSVIEALGAGRIRAVRQPDGGGYFKFPDSAAVTRLFDSGHRLLSVRDLWAILRGDYDSFEPDRVTINVHPD